MNTYLKKINESLEKYGEIKPTREGMTFSTLKILEYWARILIKNPECVNREVAVRLMDEEFTMSFVSEVVKKFHHYIRPRKAPVLRAGLKKGAPPIPDRKAFNDNFMDLEEDFCDDVEISAEVCAPRFLRAVSRYVKEASPECRQNAAGNLIKVINNTDSDDMAPQLYQELPRIACDPFMAFIYKTLKKGMSEKDPSFKRVMQVKETYRLSDDELELLIYLWLRNSPDLEIEESQRSFMRHHRFRDNDCNGNGIPSD